jgi:RNA polymerase sigma-70 factor (ECF subfamily)
LYRIATTACLRALENRGRRVLPAGLGAGSIDPDVNLGGDTGAYRWLEPLPDAMTPETAVVARESVRLAVMTAMQELPARQRAVLILRDVVQFSAAEVAELLDTTPAAVNSALQRARAHLAEVAPTGDSAAEPEDTDTRALLDRYCAAFESADLEALTTLLEADVRLEMPPVPVWFTGRGAVTRFLAKRAFTRPGDLVLIPTAANAQPAVADYRRGTDGILEAHAIHVITTGTGGISAITVFLEPALFAAFGMPLRR